MGRGRTRCGPMTEWRSPRQAFFPFPLVSQAGSRWEGARIPCGSGKLEQNSLSTRQHANRRATGRKRRQTRQHMDVNLVLSHFLLNTNSPHDPAFALCSASREAVIPFRRQLSARSSEENPLIGPRRNHVSSLCHPLPPPSLDPACALRRGLLQRNESL